MVMCWVGVVEMVVYGVGSVMRKWWSVEGGHE